MDKPTRVLVPGATTGSGRAERIAGTVLFLASEEASHVNGAIVPVNDARSAI